MNEKVFARHEFLSAFSLPETSFREWEKLELIKPVGFTDGKVPLYCRETAERAKCIQKLTELGYEAEEIRKIMKKVGLPRGAEAKASPQSASFLTIGNLAEKVNLSPRTIKHWEDKGIIVPDMRSEGGFRLYSGDYVRICELIRDLQLFGYSLEEIKDISDGVRDLLAIQKDIAAYPQAEVGRKLDRMLEEMRSLSERMSLLHKGIKRWEDLLKKKRKEVLALKDKYEKRESKRPKGA